MIQKLATPARLLLVIFPALIRRHRSNSPCGVGFFQNVTCQSPVCDKPVRGFESAMGTTTIYREPKGIKRNNNVPLFDPSSVGLDKNLSLDEHTREFPENHDSSGGADGARGTCSRARRLISAAVRLWELKRGNR